MSENVENAQTAVVVGGKDTKATGEFSVAIGGVRASATGEQSVCVGGGNIKEGELWSNVANGYTSLAIGGTGCEASGDYSCTIAGVHNKSTDNTSLCIGGEDNVSCGEESTIVGGSHNVASGECSLIAGSQKSEATGRNSAVIGCHKTKVDKPCSVALGGSNHAILNTEEHRYYVSICGCGNTERKQSAMMAVSQCHDDAKVFIKGLGGWDGDSFDIMDCKFEDVAKIVNSLIERVEALETQISKLKNGEQEQEEDAPKTEEKSPHVRTGTREEQYESVKNLLIPNMDELSKGLDEN